MEFISASSVSQSDPGGEAEITAWNKLKRCFNSSERGVLYHQYPIIQKGGSRFDRKPDFVLLHEEMGLVVIECKGYTIEHIDRIEGDTWVLQNMTQRTATPLEQARNQGFFLTSYFQREPELRDNQGQCTVSMTPVVVLPHVKREEWENRGFVGPSAPRVITGDELGKVTLRDRLESLPNLDPLNKSEYDAARGVLSCGQPISGSHGEVSDDPKTKAEYYDLVTTGIRGLDEKQQKIGLQIPPGPQQIRGIAGSGKTVLVAMKAARMLSDPNGWKPSSSENPQIALTFSTKSLYGHITTLVDRYYEQFSGQSLKESDASIDIIHGWGGSQTGDGVYYRIANEVENVSFRNFGQAQAIFSDADDPQEAVAAEVLEEGDIPDLWDAILIDEAQDFGPDFLNMCREALTADNRLIWAYDEAQDLGSLEAPSPKNLFGTDTDGDPLLDLSGTYKNGPQKTYIMRKAYRAHRSLLMTAHALGMGLKRDGGPVQMITRQDGWENLGYEIDADFRKTGSEARLSRPQENSPHPLQDTIEPDRLLCHHSFASKADEIEWVAKQIREDIFEGGLKPEEILVIPLSRSRRSGQKNRNYVNDYLSNLLEKHEIETNAVWQENGNTSEDGSKVFSSPGQVTVSAINRAKGNEAASVYVLGVDSTTEEDWRGKELNRRNELFVALTRARAWCTITGSNPDTPIHEEVESVLSEVNQSNPELIFEVPNSKDLTHELEEDTEDLVDTGLDDFL
ncbi:DNA/RNA helicase [Halorubrum sp. SD690R]|uniref:ATP-binding domain-containing protein n=1 Tax=Halorubrum sp. SD690R TaxID=2518117 RepID=UPI0010F575E8|nr:nuclease-related domain-containing DEAD/DEAH box helicase [Halorubrum sp. SD690R]TKX45555.1 DNA/RNA helicase [Halorubrum sp. SD690R]